MSAEDRGTKGVSRESFFEVSVPVGVTRSLKYKTVGQIRTCVNCSDQSRDFREISLYLQSLKSCVCPPPLKKNPNQTLKKCEKQKTDC